MLGKTLLIQRSILPYPKLENLRQVTSRARDSAVYWPMFRIQRQDSPTPSYPEATSQSQGPCCTPSPACECGRLRQVGGGQLGSPECGGWQEVLGGAWDEEGQGGAFSNRKHGASAG